MIDEYFQILTTFPPRNFQRQTIAKLLQRQDILLRAPTGSGKTETAMMRSIRPKGDRTLSLRQSPQPRFSQQTHQRRNLQPTCLHSHYLP